MRDTQFEPEGKELEGYQLERLIQHAEDGDGKALATLRKTIRRPDVWDAAWGSALLARQVIAADMAGTDSGQLASVETKLAALRKDLTSKSPSNLEKLLVERVAVAWLGRIHANALALESPEVERTEPQKVYFHRRLTEATKRHELALKLLEVVGKKLKAAKRKGIDLTGVRPAPGSQAAHKVVPVRSLR